MPMTTNTVDEIYI